MNIAGITGKPESVNTPVKSDDFIFPVLLMVLAGFSLFFSLFVLKSLIICFLAYYLLTCLAIPLTELLLMSKKNPQSILRFIELTPLRSRSALFGLYTGLGMTTIMVLAFFFLRDIFFKDNRILASVEAWGIPVSNVVIIFIIMLIFNGAVEELFWRGYIHAKFKPMKNRIAAVGIPALFFCALHFFVISSIITHPLAIALCMAGIGFAGLFWGIMRERNPGLFACIISHILVTAGYLAIFYIFILV